MPFCKRFDWGQNYSYVDDQTHDQTKQRSSDMHTPVVQLLQAFSDVLRLTFYCTQAERRLNVFLHQLKQKTVTILSTPIFTALVTETDPTHRKGLSTVC